VKLGEHGERVSVEHFADDPRHIHEAHEASVEAPVSGRCHGEPAFRTRSLAKRVDVVLDAATALAVHSALPVRRIVEADGRHDGVNPVVVKGRAQAGDTALQVAAAGRENADHYAGVGGHSESEELNPAHHYYRSKSPLPEAGDVRGLAATWKRTFNTERGAGKPEEFARNWSSVGGLYGQ
jgi:hypothetical protein